MNTDFTDYTDNLLENTEFFVIAWCVGFLNTDCTDYTDSFWRRGFFFEFRDA